MEFFKKESKYYLLLLIVLLLAYLPLSTLHFAMKNDAFSDNFPDKYFLTQAIHAGIFPLWNPYMNFGFPIYADPGFAFWNPVTWLFAIIGYSAYTLTIEVLLYIFLAGVFMFRLGKWLQFSLPVAFAAACMYMCSGFFSGSIQYINFITAAAFLPLLVQSFLQLVFKPDLVTAVLLSLSFAFVTAGGHPAIPFGAVYMLVILFISIIFFQRQKIQNLKKVFLFLIVSAFLFLLLASPALYSYATIWNLYARNAPQQHFEITNIGFSISSLISFLFPFATTAHTTVFDNDVAMRNTYFSLFGFAAIFFLFKTKNKLVYSFLITAIVMFVLSLGGSFKEDLFQYLPLLKYVRTNGEFRVFMILMLCLISGFGLQYVLINQRSFLKLKSLTKYFIIICVIAIVGIFVFYKHKMVSVFIQSSNQNSSSALVKNFLENINFPVALVISLIIAIIICFPIAFYKKDLSFKIITVVLITDLIINSIIYLPVTGVGATTVQQVQSYYNNNPSGIPVPQFIPVNEIDTLNEKLTGLIGSTSYYNKKIGTVKLTDYPSYFTSTDQFFKSNEKDFVLSKPYLFLLDDSDLNSIKVTHFTSQKITLNVQSNKNDRLIFLQNNYKFWKAFDNGKLVKISTAFTTFISIPVETGSNSIVFLYDDKDLLYYCLLSLITFIVMLVILFKKRKETNNSYTDV